MEPKIYIKKTHFGLQKNIVRPVLQSHVGSQQFSSHLLWRQSNLRPTARDQQTQDVWQGLRFGRIVDQDRMNLAPVNLTAPFFFLPDLPADT